MAKECEYLKSFKKPEFDLSHISTSPKEIKNYYIQAINTPFQFSLDLVEYVSNKFNSKYDLTTDQIIEAFHAINLSIPESLYYFKNNPNYYFTEIQQVNFELDGLIILQIFGLQIFELYTSKGELILDCCHDLDFLSKGRFLYRGSTTSDEFKIGKFRPNVKSNDIQLRNSALNDNLHLGYRDRISIEKDSSNNIRIENFQKPNNIYEAEIILNDENSNWITSPELAFFYKNNLALAKMALKRSDLVYTLIDDKLKYHPEIIRILCFESYLTNTLHTYLLEYSIKIEDYFDSSEIFLLLESNRLEFYHN